MLGNRITLKNKINNIFLIIILLATFVSCKGSSNSGHYVASGEDNIILLSVSAGCESYSFRIDDSETLYVLHKRKNIDDILDGQNNIQSVNEKESRKLTNTEFNCILSMADKCNLNYSGMESNSTYNDSWEISLTYKDNIITAYYNDDSVSFLRELCDIFTKISPIDVNLHGLS